VLVDFTDIVAFFRDTGLGNLLLFVIAISPLVGWIYKKFYLNPKLQVSLISALSGNIPFPGGNPPSQRSKFQALTLRATRAPIHNCKAKLVVAGQSHYMLWDTHRDVVSVTQPRALTRDLLPEEDVQLTVWTALKNSDGEWFDLNTGKDKWGDFKEIRDSTTIEIWFLSEEGRLNKKPYRYKITGNSWDTIKMISVD